ncbi:hypothetical protein MMC34_007703 [Xylographa carneopallida]|nr:hypothetical protein [Xylographa carneopallida]
MAGVGAQPQQGPKERFFRYFQKEATALQEQMSRLEHTSTVGGERVDATDHCRSGIARLHKEVQDASSYVPAYDQRIYAQVVLLFLGREVCYVLWLTLFSQAIKALNEKLDETKASIAPKSRFTFKTAHKNPSAISLSDAAELASQQQAKIPGFTQNHASKHSSIVTTPTSFEALPNETGIRPAEPSRKDSLEKFLVNVEAKGTTKSQSSFQDPRLAKVCESSFTSSDSAESYPNMNDLNQWDQVQDFKWLKAQPSPNWSKLPAKDMVPGEVWHKLETEIPGLSLDDILKAGGVAQLET